MENLDNKNWNYFYGTDTFGKPVEVGIKEGVQYFRTYEYNGYGMTFTKWTKRKENSKIIPNYLGDRPGLEWGFNMLVGCENVKTRLPKNS